MIESRHAATSSRLADILELVFLVGLILVSGYLRFHLIDQVPPGLNSDEAVGAMGAVDTLRNGLRLQYAGQGGSGALGFHVLALSFALFGPTVAALRGTAAFAGVVSIVLAYVFVRELFRIDEAGRTEVTAPPQVNARERLNRARLLAALAAVGLAVSLWHIRSSRLAFAAIGVPFLQMPAVFFLWRGLNTGRRINFILSGVLLSAVAGVYMSGAFAPAALAAFFLLQWGIVALSKNGRGEVLLKKHFRNVAICAAVSIALFLPMAYFYLTAPEIATERARQAIFTNPLINKGDPWGTLVRSLWGNVAAFGLSPRWFQGLPPANLVIPVPVALLFVAGFAICLWRLRRPQYLFLVTNWFVMLIPSILSPDSVPHQFRAIGAAPFAYTIAGVGVVSLVELVWWLVNRVWTLVPGSDGHGKAVPVPFKVAAAVVVVGATAVAVARPSMADYRLYMNVWPKTQDALSAFHVYAVDLGKEMSKETDTHTVYLLPRDTAAGDVNPNYTVMFFNRGAAGSAWIVDDESTIGQSLQDAVRGYDRVKVVRWKTDKHTGADPKEIIRYFLEKHGGQIEKERYSYFNIDVFEMDSSEEAFNEQSLHGIDVNFGDVIHLIGYVFGDASSSEVNDRHVALAGDYLWAKLRFRLLQVPDEDLKASISIVDPAGHVAGQIDKLLLNNIFHKPATKWAAGDEVDVYYLVPVRPATAPGTYQVDVVVYDDEDKVFPVVNVEPARQATTLGEIETLPDAKEPEAKRLGISTVLNRPTQVGLALVGLAGPAGTVMPGQRFTSSIVWRADARVDGDLSGSLWVLPPDGGEGRQLTEWTSLGGPEYGTSQMTVGQYIRSWLDGRVPPDLAAGSYGLEIRLASQDGDEKEAVGLGALEIGGWERKYELPPVQYPIKGTAYGGLMQLAGYDIIPPSQPGGTVGVVLYWKVMATTDREFTTFVHVLDGTGRVVAQVDHVPGDGAYPTTAWLEGEVISDGFAIPYGEDIAASANQLEIGAYDSITLERLTVVDGDGGPLGNRVVVPVPHVSK